MTPISVEEGPYGWVVAAVATVCLALGFAANITVSLLMEPFEHEFGWTRAQISLGYTALSAGAALGGLFWGGLSDRVGAKRIALLGALVLSSAIAWLSQQTQLWTVYALFFAIGGLGLACLVAPLLALVGLWFERRKGLAIGMVTAGGALGQAVAPVVIQSLISAHGWRDALLYVGLTYLATLVPPLLLLLRRPPVLEREPARVRQSDDNLWRLPHRITIPWLALAGVFCCICMSVPIVHLVPLAVGIGLPATTAASLLSTLMLSAVAGRLVIGTIADRTGALVTYFAASTIQTAAVFWFSQTQSLPALYAIAVIFGFGFAGVMTSLLICAREAAPLRVTGLAIATVSTTGWVGMGIGGYLGGYLYDLTGAYALSFGAAAVAGVINLTIQGSLGWYRLRRTGAVRITRAATAPAPAFE